MTVETIKEAIVHLSAPERLQLVDWFDELTEDEWDRQIEKDFSSGGRGYHLLEEVEADIGAGRTESI